MKNQSEIEANSQFRKSQILRCLSSCSFAAVIEKGGLILFREAGPHPSRNAQFLYFRFGLFLDRILYPQLPRREAEEK